MKYLDDISAAVAPLREKLDTFSVRERLLVLFTALVLMAALALTTTDIWISYSVWVFSATIIVASAIVGRALFYVLVIPTTMPGAFFWRNKGFEEHARESGLADMHQVGVVPDAH